jgi:hypothetical protein
MKKYSKPRIAYESFEMSVSVASCGIKSPLQSEGDCGYPTRNGVVFIDPTTGCNRFYQDGTYNGLCYHVPTDYFALFGS